MLLIIVIFTLACGSSQNGGITPAQFVQNSTAAVYSITGKIYAKEGTVNLSPSRYTRAIVAKAGIKINGQKIAETDNNGEYKVNLSSEFAEKTISVEIVKDSLTASFSFSPLETSTSVKMDVEFETNDSVVFNLSHSDKAGTILKFDKAHGKITVVQEAGGEKLTVKFIDVGQGDSSYIRFPNGKTMIIDCGDSSSGSDRKSGEETIGRYLHENLITTIDYLLVSHAHEDHVGGAIYVLNNFEVKNIIDSGTPHTTRSYESYLQLIDRNNIPYNQITESFKIDDSIEIQILHRGGDFSSTDLNNNSLVVKLVYNKISVLFCGDIEDECQELMNSRHNSQKLNLKSTVIKVPHHGSNTSHNVNFIKNVSPEAAMISLGLGNRYGHPSPVTLSRYDDVNTKVYRTDYNGTISFSTDGVSYSVITEK